MVICFTVLYKNQFLFLFLMKRRPLLAHDKKGNSEQGGQTQNSSKTGKTSKQLVNEFTSDQLVNMQPCLHLQEPN